MIRHALGRLIDICVLPLVPARLLLRIEYFKRVKLLKWEPEIEQICRLAKPGS